MDGFEFMRNVDAILNKRGETRSSLYHAVGIPKTTVSNWSNGGKLPSMDAAIKIAAYLNCSLDLLLSGREFGPGTVISEDEKKMLSVWNELDEANKTSALAMINGLIANQESENRLL